MLEPLSQSLHHSHCSDRPVNLPLECDRNRNNFSGQSDQTYPDAGLEQELTISEALAQQIQLGHYHFEQGQLEESIACYRRVLAIDPNQIEIYSYLAEILSQVGKLSEAADCYRKAIELTASLQFNTRKSALEIPHEPEPEIEILASSSTKIPCFQQIEGNPAQQLYDVQSTSGVTKSMANGSSNGKGAMVIQDSGFCLAQAEDAYQQKDWQQTITHCRNALQSQPSLSVYKLLGNALQQLGEFAEAVELYLAAIELEPQSAEIYANLGSLYAQQQRWQEAVVYYQRAIDLKPDFAGAYRNLAKVWTQLEQSDKAADCWYHAFILQPEKVSAAEQINLGNLLLGHGQIDAAIDCYRQSIHCEPTLVGGYQNLITVLIQQGKEQEAEQVYRQALELGLTMASTDSFKQELQSLEDKTDKPEERPEESVITEPGVLKQVEPELAQACRQFDESFRARQELMEVIRASTEALKQLEPEVVETCRQLAESFYEKDNLAEAIRYYQRVVELEPNSAADRVNLGSLYAQQQQWQEAISCYQKAIALDANLASAHWNLAKIWQATDQPEQAAESFLRALRLEPSWASLSDYLTLGRALRSQGNQKATIACYQHIIQQDVTCAEAHSALGEIFARQQQWQESITHYRQAILYRRDNLKDLVSLAQVFVAAQQWQKAHAVYRQVISRDPQPANYLGLAQCLEQQRHWDEAIECYQALATLHPHWQVYHRLGDLLNQQQRWAEAVVAFRQAIELNSEHSWSYNNLGDALIHLEQWQEATEAFQYAIILNPDFHWSHYNLGEALAKLEQWDRAIAAYQRAAQLQADIPYIHQKLGDVLRHRAKADCDAALCHYQQAIDKDPDDEHSYHGSLEIQPNNVDFYLGLGNALTQKGQSDQASVFYQIGHQIRAGKFPIAQPFSRSFFNQPSLTVSHPVLETGLSRNPWDYMQLILPLSKSPIISIIIPIFNKIDYTFRCLVSLAKHLDTSIDVEVIVVNDCSTDETKNVLEQVKGLVLINQEKNSGFIHSCNRGALAAKGDYLYFLNNDTEIHPRCIEELMAVLLSDTTVGAVGSKLIYPHGALQEAGGIIWNDASGWNYGRTDNPIDPQYNYLRPVDYCSGASLMVRKTVFESLNGFEQDFVPAYYEDADLCFAIRHQLGMKVMYQPKSEVIHYEGISSGTSTESGVKRYQVVNAEKFQQKWQGVIPNQLPNQGIADVPKAARRYLGDRTILIIDSYLPCHDQESGSRRLFELIKIFKQLNYHVIFVPDNSLKSEPYTTQLQNMQVEVLYTCNGYGTSVREQIQNRLDWIDIAWICRPELNQKYAALLRHQPNIKIIYDTIDLHYIRLRRAWEMLPSRNMDQAKEWLEMQKLELSMALQADLTVTVTPVEKELLHKCSINNVEVIPNIHNPYVGERKPFHERTDLLFIGGYNHQPNIDAVVWLCEAIMPIVWQQFPDMRITLLGNNPPKQVKNLASSKVSVPGFIQDVSSYFLTHRVFVAPLRYGAGMKGKIGQSLEYGLPIVSTTIGIEGMNLKAEHDALVADTAESFAAQILRLYQDEKLWNFVALNAEKVIEPYSTSAIQIKVARLLQQLI